MTNVAAVAYEAKKVLDEKDAKIDQMRDALIEGLRAAEAIMPMSDTAHPLDRFVELARAALRRF